MDGDKLDTAHSYFKDPEARRQLRAWLNSEGGRVVLQEIRTIRHNNNDLQAVAAQAQDSVQLAKIVAEQGGYVRALDSVLALFETLAGESK